MIGLSRFSNHTPTMVAGHDHEVCKIEIAQAVYNAGERGIDIGIQAAFVSQETVDAERGMVAVPAIAPTPADFGVHIWRMLQASIAHCNIGLSTDPEFPVGTIIDLRDEAIELGLRVVCTTDRRYILREIVEDIEDYKHGGPSIEQRWFSHKGRARIAYGIAKLRALRGWHHLELPTRKA